MEKHGYFQRAAVGRADEQMEVAGVQVPRGATLMLLLASANLDEAAFPNAHRLDWGLEAREWCSEAAVRAQAERDVTVGSPVMSRSPR